jgi:hypothetical protein
VDSASLSFEEFFRERGYSAQEDTQALADWLTEAIGKPVSCATADGGVLVGSSRTRHRSRPTFRLRHVDGEELGLRTFDETHWRAGDRIAVGSGPALIVDHVLEPRQPHELRVLVVREGH